MITSNRRIRALGLTGELIFDAEEIAAGDWRFTGSKWPGLLRASREMLITAIADLIGDGDIYALEASEVPVGRVHIDRAGNIWLDHEYLAPHQYLPRLILEKP